jgi:hypothetical protein
MPKIFFFSKGLRIKLVHMAKGENLLVSVYQKKKERERERESERDRERERWTLKYGSSMAPFQREQKNCVHSSSVQLTH